MKQRQQQVGIAKAMHLLWTQVDVSSLYWANQALFVGSEDRLPILLFDSSNPEGAIKKKMYEPHSEFNRLSADYKESLG